MFLCLLGYFAHPTDTLVIITLFNNQYSYPHIVTTNNPVIHTLLQLPLYLVNIIWPNEPFYRTKCNCTYGSICPGWIFPKYLSFFAKSWKPVAPSI